MVDDNLTGTAVSGKAERLRLPCVFGEKQKSGAGKLRGLAEAGLFAVRDSRWDGFG